MVPTASRLSLCTARDRDMMQLSVERPQFPDCCTDDRLKIIRALDDAIICQANLAREKVFHSLDGLAFVVALRLVSSRAVDPFSKPLDLLWRGSRHQLDFRPSFVTFG